LVFLGLYNAVLAYPRSIASYVVSVRQYRILQSRFLHCIPREKPTCGLLILLSVTSAYKGLSPSGKMHPLKVSFLTENLYFRSFSRAYSECALLMQGAHRCLAKVAATGPIQAYYFYKTLFW
jgi:hypothetical protein